MKGERTYGIGKPKARWHPKAVDFGDQLSAGIYSPVRCVDDGF